MLWIDNLNTVTMKKTILSILLLAAFFMPAKAGDGDRHIGFQAGVLYPGILNGVISVDFETRYHNTFEVYIDAFTEWKDCKDCGKVCRESFWKSNYGLGIGAAYKPVVSRSRNNVGRFRFGGDIGTCSREFSLGIEIGYEHVWTFKNNVQFVIQQKNEVTFWGKPLWRLGGLVGLRLPL